MRFKTLSGRPEQMEHYDCNRLCFPAGEEDHHRRCTYRCTLQDLQGADVIPESEWLNLPEEWPAPHMGLLRDATSEDQNRLLEHPLESHYAGCPGGWYRCDFITSLLPFEPLRVEGQYQRCYELDSTDSPLVHGWVRLLQTEQIRHSAHEMDQWSPGNKS